MSEEGLVMRHPIAAQSLQREPVEPLRQPSLPSNTTPSAHSLTFDGSCIRSFDEPDVDQPSSPLSVQQGGGSWAMYCPPFGMAHLSPEPSDSDADAFPTNLVLTDSGDSHDDVAAQSQIQECTTMVLVTDTYTKNNVCGTELSTRSTVGVNSYEEKQSLAHMEQRLRLAIQPTNRGDVPEVQSTTSTDVLQQQTTRKSIRELYGIPSWWGDGEASHSYPHASLLNPPKDGTSLKKTVEKSVVPSVQKSKEHIVADSPSTHPRSEAYVFDFGRPKGATDEPSTACGKLSQCVPARIRRVFDERERQKQEREKRKEELRQQDTESTVKASKANKPLSSRPNVARSTTITANTTRGTCTVRGLSARGRDSQSAKNTRPSASPTPVRTVSRPTVSTGTRHRVPNVPARNAPGRTPISTNATHKLASRGYASVTPSLTSFPTTTSRQPTSRDTNLPGSPAWSARNGSQNERKSFIGPTDRIRNVVMGADLKKASVCTSVSGTSRRSAPPIKATLTNSVTKRGSTTAHTSVTNARSTGRGASSTKAVPSRGVGPTQGGLVVANSNAIQRRSLVAPPVVTSSTGLTRSPMLGNSSKKPVTTTQLRRPAGSTRTGVNRLQRSATVSSELPRRLSESKRYGDVTATVMATLDMYDDPKDYLFYRMFQGAELLGIVPTVSPKTPAHSKSDFLTVDSKRQAMAVTESSSDGEVTRERSVDVPDAPSSSMPLNQTVPSNAEYDVVNQSSPAVKRQSFLPDEQFLHCDPVLPSRFPVPSDKPDATAASSFDDVTSPVPTVTEPTVSKSFVPTNHCPVALHPPVSPFTTNNVLSTSLLVSTSVTSLAPSQTGTYVLHPEETLTSRSAARRVIDNSNLVSTGVVESDLATPHGSLSDVRAATEKTTTPHALNLSDISGQPLSTVKKPICTREFPGAPPVNRPLSPKLLRSSTREASGNQPSMSTSAWVETWQDDFELDRTEAPALSLVGLDNSALVSASVSSLAPSCAGTYVLDMDDTLAAQGVPPVVIHSREDLLSSNASPHTSYGSRAARTRTLDTSTPTYGSPTTANHKGVLWDVLETEECSEDLMSLRPTDQLPCSQKDTYPAANFGCTGSLDDEEETYKSLPTPVWYSGVMENRISLDSGKGTDLATSSRGSTFKSESKQCPDTSSTFMSLFTSGAPTSAKQRGTPSHSSANLDILCPPSPSTPYCQSSGPFTASGLNCSTASFSSAYHPVLSYAVGMPSTQLENVTHVADQDTPSSRTLAYTPLTNIHQCYRALQESVNYLIHSQDGMKRTDEQPHKLVASSQLDTSTMIPLGVQHPSYCSVTAGPERLPSGTQPQLSSNVDAMWPCNLASWSRRSLSRVNRHHRKHLSTGSLDSAEIQPFDLQKQSSHPQWPRGDRVPLDRLGSSSVPEPGSPSSSIGRDHFNDSISLRTPQIVQDRRCSGGLIGETNEQSLQRVHLGTIITDVTSMPKTETATGAPSPSDQPTIDSRTFTRRKAPQQGTSTQSPQLDSLAYREWIASMSTISQGINALIDSSNNDPNQLQNPRVDEPGESTRIPVCNSKPGPDLPDSTTGPAVTAVEPVRSAFVTPLPQRSLGATALGVGYKVPERYNRTIFDTPGQQCNTTSNVLVTSLGSKDLTASNESAMYYTLMVNSIRQLSLKLRQCSDNLVQRINSEQPNIGTSTQVNNQRLITNSVEGVSSYTKCALSDALENMHTINEQLKIVDQLLFSADRDRMHNIRCSRDTSLHHWALNTLVPTVPESKPSNNETFRLGPTRTSTNNSPSDTQKTQPSCHTWTNPKSRFIPVQHNEELCETAKTRRSECVKRPPAERDEEDAYY